MTIRNCDVCGKEISFDGGTFEPGRGLRVDQWFQCEECDENEESLKEQACYRKQ